MTRQYKPLDFLKEDFESELDNIDIEFDKLIEQQKKVASDFADIKKQIMETVPKETLPSTYATSPAPDSAAPWYPITFLGLDVVTAGFAYNPLQDIIYSTMYNYQRLLGYCRFYDDTSFLILSRLDSEVITFEFESWQYMIELWKGQYGIETGGEIGIYRRQKDKPLTKLEKEVTGPLYACVPDDARLPMSFELSKQGAPDFLMKRSQLHWWLTGFHWGIFTEPEELQMNLSITFPDSRMLESFQNALVKLGYKQQDITITGKQLSFLFNRPYTPQPETQQKLGPMVQAVNKEFVGLYTDLKEKLDISSDDPNIIWTKLLQSTGSAVNRLIKNIEQYFNNRLVIR